MCSAYSEPFIFQILQSQFHMQRYKNKDIWIFKSNFITFRQQYILNKKKSLFSGSHFDEKHCQSKSIMIINWSRESSWEASTWCFFTPLLFIVNSLYMAFICNKRFSRMSQYFFESGVILILNSKNILHLWPHLSTTLSELVYVRK